MHDVDAGAVLKALRLTTAGVVSLSVSEDDTVTLVVTKASGPLVDIARRVLDRPGEQTAEQAGEPDSSRERPGVAQGEPEGRFQVGDTVWWTSQSQGYRRLKRGVVALVIHPGEVPHRFYHSRTLNPGMGRAHESYLVRVPRPGLPAGEVCRHSLTQPCSHVWFYWPKVSDLVGPEGGYRGGR